MPPAHPCSNHPDREGVVYCEKYKRHLCRECIGCRQPENHCKFRPMCMIWEFEKHGIPEEFQPREAEDTPEESLDEKQAAR